jgi:hypothetical protein
MTVSAPGLSGRNEPTPARVFKRTEFVTASGQRRLELNLSLEAVAT